MYSKCTHNESDSFNTLRPKQNGWYIVHDIFKFIFINENVVEILSQSNQQYFSCDTDRGLVPVDDKPLSDQWCSSLMTHICVTVPRLIIIAQVYRLSAVHCQMTRYSQRVPGYLTRYSVSANEISFDKKNQPIRLCLSNQVRPGREWFPSPLGDFNRLFEGLIGELFKIWHWNMFYFF